VFTIDVTNIDHQRLAPMLRAWAEGLPSAQAAVELVIAHGVWTRRLDFLGTLVDAVSDGWGRAGTTEPMASIDWDGVEDFLATAPASSSEIAVLRLAASLAGAKVGVPLRDMTSCLDDTNGALFLNALAHRYGWHERGRSQVITGSFTTDRRAV
jgi:hypothetical protein